MASKIPETRPAPKFPESSFKYNPLMHVRVLFVRFAQGLFSASQEGNYRWTPDEETTEISIGDEDQINPAVVQKMPAISFTRGPVQFYGVGLDDLHALDFSTDKKTKGVLLPGTMTANCCARLPLESEHIAFVLGEHLWLLRHILMRNGFFEVGREIQVGAPSPAGSVIAGDRGDEFSCTPVSVPFQFARESSVTPLGQYIANHIETTLNVRGPRRVGSDGILQQGHQYPYGHCSEWPPPFAPQARDLPQRSPMYQPHPLNPSKTVRVRVVRSNGAGSRLIHSRAAIPIRRQCVEQSDTPAVAFQQKG